MKKIAFSAIALFGLLFAQSTFAAQFLVPAKDDQQGSVVVGADDSYRNLYTVGAQVTVNGNTQGDLFAAGSSVTVDGDVEQDANIAGANVGINGKIGGDLRTAGANITIRSQISGDLLAAAANLSIADKAGIGGDAYLAGTSVVIDAPVHGDVKVAGTKVTINAKVDGNVIVRAEQEVTFGPKAEITGKITVTSPKAPTVKDGARITSPELKTFEVRQSKKGAAGIIGFFFFIKLLAYFIAAWIAINLFGKTANGLVENIQRRPWANLGIGFVGLVVGPIAIIALFLTVVGFYVGIFAILIYLIILALSCILAASFLGSWIMMKLRKRTSLILDWQAVGVGVVVYSLIGLIPFIGWLLDALIMLAAFGALLVRFKDSFDKKHQHAEVVSPS